MESRIIGKIDLDEESVDREIERILSFPADPRYRSYSFGNWSIYLLWNSSGDSSDSTLHEFEGAARITELGARLPYLNSVVKKYFRTEKLKWVRAFLLRDASIIPHRDYLEFKKPLTRIHLALSTDEGSLHSEDEHVFQMRKGEIWYLAVEKVHSAASLNDFPRMVLCMEFDLEDGAEPEDAFRDSSVACSTIAPKVLDLPPPSVKEFEGIYSLGKLISEKNYRDIVQLLSRIHFYKKANAGDFFNWLLVIARLSENQTLVEKTLEFKRNCIENRPMNETLASIEAVAAAAAGGAAAESLHT